MRATSTDDVRPFHLRVDGWRGINHSFAMVNQCQLLELLALPWLSVSHRDAPFAMAHWSSTPLDAGFAAADAARLAALPAPSGRADAVLRIASPYVAPDDAAPCTSFIVTELGLTRGSFADPAVDLTAFTRGAHRVVTPSQWSRARIAEHGLDAERIDVVSHGVRGDIFQPMADADRRVQRRAIGLRDDDVVLLNLGAPMWNKGLDVLLLAFARAHAARPALRLMLKDQQALYGVSVTSTLGNVAAAHPGLFTASVLGALRVVSGSLTLAQLRTLYGCADRYVSPYRAEGFNLPVLEAIASGTPAIVTDGGATDDFCDADVATRIPSRPGVLARDGDGVAPGRCREPDVDALVALLVDAADAPRRPARFEPARARLVERLSWANVVRDLARPWHAAAHAVVPPAAAPHDEAVPA